MNNTSIFKRQVKDLMLSCAYSQIAYNEYSHVKQRYAQRQVSRLLKYYDGTQNLNHKLKRDAQAYMFKHGAKLIITFRGTMSKDDFLDAIDVRHAILDPSGSRVHNGFYQQFKSIEPSITSDICSIMEYQKEEQKSIINEIIFTGHSMGGALAALAAGYYGALSTLYNLSSVRMLCHTFGNPVFADSTLGRDILSHVDDHICVFMTEDVIPFIPIHSDFKHLPRIIELDSEGVASCRIEDTSSYMRFFNKLWCAGSFESIFKSHSSYMYYRRLHTLYLCIKALEQQHHNNKES